MYTMMRTSMKIYIHVISMRLHGNLNFSCDAVLWNCMDVNLHGCSHHHIMHWGIKPPLKTPLPFFYQVPPPASSSPSPPVKPANCPVNSQLKFPSLNFQLWQSKTFFVYKLFLSLNTLDFSLFSSKTQNLTPSHSQRSPSKNRDPVKTPFLKNSEEDGGGGGDGPRW